MVLYFFLRQITPVVIEPVNIGIDESEIDGPSPPKRAKLKGTYESSMVKLQTPIVKRKTPRVSSRMSIDRENVCTPHSILKVSCFRKIFKPFCGF